MDQRGKAFVAVFGRRQSFTPGRPLCGEDRAPVVIARLIRAAGIS